MLRIQKAVLKAKDSQEHKSIRQQSEIKKSSSKSQSPLESLEYSKTRVLPVHPDRFEDQRVVSGFLNNDISQVFRTLRTQVIQVMRENNWRSLAITSPSEGEGKSTIAANLALAIAMEVNQTVLLVDLDLKDPSLHERFDVQQDKGLLDHLEGRVTLEEIMINPGVDRLVLVPGSGTTNKSSEIISSPKMVDFFNETRNRYRSRIVIYDMPPILPTDDVLSCVTNIDCALMVLEDGRNSEKDIIRAVRQLEKTNIIGTVLNKFEKGRWLL